MVTDSDLQTVNLDIEGMRCAGCVASVERALNSPEGVHEARVNFATHRARVSLMGGG